jgi:RNA polymerase sigma factor (sigma-70 family)
MNRTAHSLLHHIQTIFDSGVIGELTDRQLVERFAGRDREMAELCFGVLIKRHGPLVLRTCQAILHNRHDAEDAFQATFLVLARKAQSLWIRDSLGPWLFDVACRVAASARSAALRRRNRERQAAGMRASTTEDMTGDDRGAVICAELERLPDRYRTAVVLCDVEGLTQERAAQILGWPAGTVRSRLARGRQRLRDRLTHRGLAPSVVSALPWLTADAPGPAVPAALLGATTHVAAVFVANGAASGTTASVRSLPEGALRAMSLSKLKIITTAILACGLVAGTALLAHWSWGFPQVRPPEPRADAPSHDGVESKSPPTVPDPAGTRSLSPTATARIDVAKRLRDGIYERYRIDPSSSFTEVLTWQNRYHEVIAEVLVKTDADQIRFLEHRVASLKRIEQFIKDVFNNRLASSNDVLAAELYRLEAEDRLEKARAKAKAGGVASTGTASIRLVQFLDQDSWTPQFPSSKGQAGHR